MTIGEAAAASGMKAKMIRYYESIGLVRQVQRTEAGYRLYSEADVDTLRFIHRARGFGLPIERIRLLVGLWQDGTRASRDVKRIALHHVAELRAEIARMAAMADALQQLADDCQGDHRPECPILRDLEGLVPGSGDAAPGDSGSGLRTTTRARRARASR